VWEIKVKRIKQSCIGTIGGHSSRDGSHPTLQSNQMTVLQCVSSHVLQCKVKGCMFVSDCLGLQMLCQKLFSQCHSSCYSFVWCTIYWALFSCITGCWWQDSACWLRVMNEMGGHLPYAGGGGGQGFWWGNLQEGGHIENLGVDGKIILKWIWMKHDGRRMIYWTASTPHWMWCFGWPVLWPDL